MKAEAPEHPIHELLVARWSPTVYEPRTVEPEKLQACLTAAAWAPSSFNEQPWVFLVARREEEQAFARMLSCLMETNQQWAQHAGVLMLTAVKRHFTRNGKPNRVAEHDLGAAATCLALQAAALGLQAHQMAGVELSKIRTTYAIAEGYDPMTAIALGYPGDPSQADEQLAARDLATRRRKPLAEFAFGSDWGAALFPG